LYSTRNISTEGHEFDHLYGLITGAVSIKEYINEEFEIHLSYGHFNSFPNEKGSFGGVNPLNADFHKSFTGFLESFEFSDKYMAHRTLCYLAIYLSGDFRRILPMIYLILHNLCQDYFPYDNYERYKALITLEQIEKLKSTKFLNLLEKSFTEKNLNAIQDKYFFLNTDQIKATCYAFHDSIKMIYEILNNKAFNFDENKFLLHLKA
jgi:hypothetical protein